MAFDQYRLEDRFSLCTATCERAGRVAGEYSCHDFCESLDRLPGPCAQDRATRSKQQITRQAKDARPLVDLYLHTTLHEFLFEVRQQPVAGGRSVLDVALQLRHRLP